MHQRSGEPLDALSPQEKRALLAQLQARRGQKPRSAPLSLAQERLLALCQMDPHSPAYNITNAYRLQGPLDVALLEQALNQIVQRQAALRTSFATVDGRPAQKIAAELTLRLALHDLEPLPPEARERQVREIVVRQGRQLFDLERAPLLRACVMRLAPDEHILAFTTHRLVFDGQCWPVLIAELSAYVQAAGGAPARLPELPLQYADFATWQRSWLQGPALEGQLDYWREQFGASVPLLRLPLDHPRAPDQIRSRLEHFTLSAEVSEGLRRLSRQAGVSVFVSLLAAFQALLHHTTGQEQFVIFSSVAGRSRPELTGLLGLFANILALRADLSGAPTFRELLERARATAAGAYAHQDVPFEHILEHVRFERDQRYASIFQAMLVFWPEQLPPLDWPGVALHPLDIDIKPAEFDLLLHVTNTQPAMSGMLRYKADLFEPASVARLVARLQQLLAAVVADPDQPLAALARPQVSAEQGPVTGALPIMPSQWGYLRAPERWVNMVEVVTLEQRPDPALLAQAVQALVAHHDALRTRFVRDGGAWRQELLAPGGAPPLGLVDLSQEPPERRQEAIAAHLAALQPRLGPLAEALLQITLFDQGPGLPAHLVFSIHHAICDNASLPMLLEDLHRAYAQLARGEAVRLPPKTTSVRQWAEHLEGYLGSQAFQQRLDAELALLQPPGAPLPVDDPAGRARNTQASVAQVQAGLSAEDTLLLVKEFPRAHRVWLRDILLAGLVQALAGWSGGPRVTLEIVDTGRHLDLPGADALDLTRTAGCLFVPGILTLERPDTADALAALREVSAQIGRYPTYGIAAGMAQQSGAADAVPPAEMRLNYLGLADLPELPGWQPYTGSAMEDVVASRRHAGIDRSPVLLNCTAIVLDGQLVTRWEYSQNLHRRETVEALAGAFVAALQELAAAERARRAQAGPSAQARAYAAPRTPEEQLLAEIWAQALGRERVSIHDNFFELGGDSITGLRIVATANQAGLPITPKLLSERQTIAELLAPAAAPATAPAEQGAVLGPAPLSPIQHWRLERTATPHHWNDAVLFEVDQALDPALLEQSLAHLLAHHDGLRSRFSHSDGAWRLAIAAPEPDFRLERIDLSALPADQQGPALERQATRMQTSLDLAHGPLLRVALFQRGAGQSGRLLIIIHHLLLDGYSLEILMADLWQIYLQLASGQPVALPPKTTSVKQWAERMQQHINSAQAQPDLDYWLERARRPAPALPRDRDGANSHESKRWVEYSLGADATATLLRSRGAGGSGPSDFILAALTRAFAAWTGSPLLQIDLIQQNRTALTDGLNLSRTVGWFDAMVPVLLDTGAADSPAAALELVKRQLAQVPNQGVGYGLLRYLHHDPEVRAAMRALPDSGATLNYLGVMEHAEDLRSLVRPVAEPIGPLYDQQDLRDFPFYIKALIAGGQLQISWEYSENLHRRETVERVVGAFAAALEQLAEAERARQDAAQAGQARAYAAPRTPEEQLLAEIWAQALGRERVGIHDNFFELGGDSITGLRIVAKANQAGLPITPKLLSERQTIAELLAPAASAAPARAPAEQGAVLGPAPLSPIQHWRFEHSATPQHWNEAQLLEVDQALDPVLLEQSLARLLEHHDGLRARFSPAEGAWSQRFAPPDPRAHLERFDLSGLPADQQGAALERQATLLQTTLDLEHGPLFRAALFDLGAQRPRRLLIIIHHLLLDGYSLEILMADLWQIYAQLASGQPAALPPKTTSVKQWAERMQQYINSAQAQPDLDYWLARPALPVPALPADDDGPDSRESNRVLEIALDPETTQALLRSQAARGASALAVILTALARSFAEWTGAPALAVDLLQQTRTALFDDLDLSRTVGWFDTLVPVRLEPGADTGPAEALAAVAGQLAQIPNQGLGYGMLRYLHRDAAVRERMRALPSAQLMLNYMGVLEHADGATSLARPLNDPVGPLYSPHDRRDYPLYIKASITGGRLLLRWEYSQNRHRRATVAALAERFVAAARALLA